MRSEESAIFYFSHKSRARRNIHAIWHDNQFVGYVRVEVMYGDVDDAFASARPQIGETLMNTHAIAKRSSRKRKRS